MQIRWQDKIFNIIKFFYLYNTVDLLSKRLRRGRTRRCGAGDVTPLGQPGGHPGCRADVGYRRARALYLPQWRGDTGHPALRRARS